MFKIPLFIERLAKSSMMMHKASREWQWLIIVSLLIKIFTAAFGVFAGFHWIASKFVGLSVIIGVTLGVCFVAFLEAMNAITLSKLTKMSLNKKWKAAGALFLFALLVYACSFYVSTNGLMSWKQNAPRAKVESNEKNIVASYDNRIEAINANVESIRKNTWQGKLSIQQENNLLKLGGQIEALEKQKTVDVDVEQSRVLAETNKAESVINVKADEFYNIAACIMLFQFIGNVMLTFFLFLVNSEDIGIDGAIKLKVLEWGNSINALILSEFDQRTIEISHALKMSRFIPITANSSSQTTQSSMQSQQITTTQPQQTTPQPSPRRQIGFQAVGLENKGEGRAAPPIVGGYVGDNVGGHEQHPQNDANDGKKKVVRSLGWGVCPVCGESFRLKTVNQKYCNKNGKYECRDSANIKRNGVYTKSSKP